MDLVGKNIMVTGGAGFLGRVVVEELRQSGVALEDVYVPRSSQYDLTDVKRVRECITESFNRKQPNIIIHLAAEVGGIGANQKSPGRFFYANMAMGLHIIEEARKCDVEKFVQIGTVCGYPKYTATPFKESSLWDGYPEETNAPYGIAKKALLTMCQAYRDQYDFNAIYLLPVNLYGPCDNFDFESSHVIPAIIRKCVEAKARGDKHIICWGTGNPTREFLYVDDCARGIVDATINYNGRDPVNLGTGHDISIKDLVELVAEFVGFDGVITWDTTKPDGQPSRCLDVSRAREMFGFSATISLEDGLRKTVDWYRSHYDSK